MHKRKYNKPITKRKIFDLGQFLLGIFAGLCALAIFVCIDILIQYIHQPHTKIITPVLETNRTMVKKLPSDIKKQIIAASPSATFRVPILLYHYVENIQDKKDKLRAELNVTPSVFEDQI